MSLVREIHYAVWFLMHSTLILCTQGTISNSFEFCMLNLQYCLTPTKNILKPYHDKFIDTRLIHVITKDDCTCVF